MGSWAQVIAYVLNLWEVVVEYMTRVGDNRTEQALVCLHGHLRK